jgi:hypothetical protein
MKEGHHDTDYEQNMDQPSGNAESKKNPATKAQ